MNSQLIKETDCGFRFLDVVEITTAGYITDYPRVIKRCSGRITEKHGRIQEKKFGRFKSPKIFIHFSLLII